MPLRTRIFIVISILVFLVLGISLFLVVRNKNTNTNTNTQTQQTGGQDNGGVITDGGQQTGSQTEVGTQTPVGLPAKVPTTLEVEKNGVIQLAKVFIERYGSYSTDNDFQNIKDVEALVTQSLWSRISAQITPKTTTSAGQSFVGVTTKVISSELTSWAGDKAVAKLKLMRTEEKDGVVANRYQDVALELVKVGSSWLVDKVVWN